MDLASVTTDETFPQYALERLKQVADELGWEIISHECNPHGEEVLNMQAEINGTKVDISVWHDGEVHFL